jgi:hypothetical protein
MSYMDANNLKNNLEQFRQCRYEALFCNHCCHGKAICVAYSECMSVVVVIQHAKCMCHIVLSSVASLAVQNFYKLSYKWHDFCKNYIELKMCVFSFPLQHLSVTEELSEI